MRFSKLTLKLNIVRYFQWRESWTYDEDDGFARYAEEDAARRKELGITEADEADWRYARANETLRAF